MPPTMARAIIMPNLRPPVVTTADALAYRDRILKALPEGSDFTPLMTLYLTDKTSPDEINRAKESGSVFAVKLYPAGATTNSDSGVTSIERVHPVLERMAEVGMPLLIHGEVTRPEVDVFEREPVFIEEIARPLVQRFPTLKVVMEHITTKEAAAFVAAGGENVAATITVHHLMYNRNALFEGGIRPHRYCLPILKHETDRAALLEAVRSGSPRFFLGTDSAPHPRGAKECGCGAAGMFTAHAAIELYAQVFEHAGCLENLKAFACENGPRFYGLEPNDKRLSGSAVEIVREPWVIPATYEFGDAELVPLLAGTEMPLKARVVKLE
jgi:dihydroorotase